MKRPVPEEYTTAQRNCAVIRSQASADNASISFVQQWLLGEGLDSSVCSAVSVETTTLRYIAQTLLNPRIADGNPDRHCDPAFSSCPGRWSP